MEAKDDLSYMVEKSKKTSLLFSCRALVSLLAFFGFTNLYILRVDLSVAIVCMVNHTALGVLARGDSNESAMKFADCGGGFEKNETQDMEDGELLWSKNEQGLVLGSFFWGYIGPQAFGGVLAMRFGAKAMFAASMLVASLATIATPLAANFHYGALMAVRVIIGLCSGVACPAGYSIFAAWVPPAERTRLIGSSMAGPPLGTIIAMVIGGLLCRFGFAGGWPSVFYVFGCLGLLWCLLWTIFVSDSPRQNRWISAREKVYIESSLKGAMSCEKKDQEVPWRSILTSRPVWALFVTHVFSNWAECLFLTQLPTYLREILGFNITENGFLSALSAAFTFVVTLFVSNLADWLLAKRIVSRNVCRKFFLSLGQFPLIIFAVATTFLSCSERNLAVAFLVIGIAFGGSHQGAGYMLTPSDLAPQYSGVIFSLSNTFATIPGVVVPSIVGAMTPERTRAQWNNVFFLTAVFCALSSLTFTLFSSAELQDWARPPEVELNIEEEKLKPDESEAPV